MFASGVPTAEKPTAKKYYILSNGPDAKDEYRGAWGKYKQYLQSTSILIPIPPALYRPMPAILKRTIFFDFPMYQFDEHTDGAMAVEVERRKKGSGSRV